MENNGTMKIDITSTLGEKVIDKVLGFVSTLIKPTVEESGLFIKDSISSYRFKKQIKILEKARGVCEKNNISTKTINLKLLCPLLEFAGIEDNEELENRWANLLANMVDSNQNIDNHVFPYILSQISLEEYNEVLNSFLTKINRQNKIKAEYDELYTVVKFNEKDIKDEIANLERRRIELHRNADPKLFEEYYKVSDDLVLLKKPTKSMRDKMYQLHNDFYTTERLNSYNLEDFEYSNLIRLGLIKNVQLPSVTVEQTKIDKNQDDNYIFIEDLNFIVDVEDSEYHLTELGEKFIFATSETNTISVPEYLDRL